MPYGRRIPIHSKSSSLSKNTHVQKAFHSRQVTSKWVARVFLEKFRLDPNMALLKIKAGILEQYEVEISMCKAYRARQIANEMINGRFEDNYLRIRDYSEELKVSNPVCEGENYDSWQWFLRLLLIDIKHPPPGAGVWNFISDQQKGLKQALEEVIPEAPTRFFLRHLYANFKNKFKGKALKDLMWAAAKETTEVGFNAKMEQIKVLNKDAYGHLKGIEAEHWSKHKFSQIPKCDMQLNNLCEVFNSKIVEARDKPILTMCEMIRKYLMTRIVKNGEQMANYRGPICPRAQDKLQLNKVEGRDSRTTVCGGNKFEINLHGK
ncbi:transposon [Fagus crenata]